MIQSDYDLVNDATCDAHSQCPRSHWCNLPARRCAPEVCGGFIYWKPGFPAETLLERMFRQFERQVAAGKLRMGEQPALNYELRHQTLGLKYAILPRTLYPNGATYFTRALRPKGGLSPYVVHNNWLSGAAAKQARFEAHGMWWLTRDEVTPFPHMTRPVFAICQEFDSFLLVFRGAPMCQASEGGGGGGDNRQARAHYGGRIDAR